MPQIQLKNSHEYIQCQPDKNSKGIWVHVANYYLSPKEEEILNPGEDYPQVKFGTDIMLSLLPFDLSSEVDVIIKFQLIPGLLAPPEEIVVQRDLFEGNSIPLAKVLDFEYLEQLFWSRSNFRFFFSIEIRELVDLKDLRNRKLIEEQVEQVSIYRQVKVFSNLSPRNKENNDLWLRDYLLTIGNLSDEIIHEISLFVIESENWEVKIDSISQSFKTSAFKSLIEQALSTQARPVMERIPTFLSQTFPETSEPLEVVIVIPYIEPGKEYKIKVDVSDPNGVLYYQTGIAVLDNCMRSTHKQLLELGVPFKLRETETYQRVLHQLLTYRYSCASTPGYIDERVAKETEIEGFHKHLLEKLSNILTTELIEVISEPNIGNSRVDLLLDGIPVELKLEERRKATTTDIVERFKGQAADYIARQNTPFGFLLVLDTVLDRDQPTSRVDQDLYLTQVPNVSGASVIVIVLIVRIPRSASDHTKLARRRLR